MARGGGFHAHPDTIEEHAGRTEGRASQLHGHAEAVGGTSMPGHALGNIGSGLTGTMTSSYQRAGTAIHGAGDRMTSIAGTERSNARGYRETESGNQSRFRSILSDGQPPEPHPHQMQTDPPTTPSSASGATSRIS